MTLINQLEEVLTGIFTLKTVVWSFDDNGNSILNVQSKNSLW